MSTYRYDTPAARTAGAAGDEPTRRRTLADLLRHVRGPSARQELPAFTQQLATLLQAGTNPPEALETLRPDLQSAALRAAVEVLEEDTKRGLPLYAGMRKHPRIFDRVYTEIVAAGEKSGTLERMLDPLAAGLVQAEKVRSKVSRAMIQPLFTLAATFVGGWYMIQNVVPTFAGIYAREGAELPVVTRALIHVAEVGSSVGNAGLAGAGVALLLLPRLLRVPGVRRWRDALVLRLPVVGALSLTSSLANFMRFFSLLLATDALHEAEAIELASQTAPNVVVANRIAAAAREVALGTSKVSGALAKTGLMPPMYVQILRTGEKTAQLGKLSLFAAERLRERTESQVEKAEAAAVPLATLMVIGVVAVLLVGLYGPMASLYEVLLRS